MLLEVITGAVERRRHHPRRRRLHLRRELRLRGRPGVLVRAEHRRHRRVAAQARLARRDGRRLGDVRGLGPPAAGDIDVAVAMGSGRSSTADPALIYPMEMDPFYLAPLGADHVSLAALQARALIDSGQGHRAADGRGRGPHPPRRQGQPAGPGQRRLRRRRAAGRPTTSRAPLRRARPAADHRRRLRGGDRPRRQGPRAVRQPGLDHRPRPLLGAATTRACATCATSTSTRSAAKAAGLDDGPDRGGRAAGLVHPRGAAAGRGARARSRRGDQPVRRPAGRQPDHGHRPGPHHRGGPARSSRPTADARSAHSSSGPCLQQNLVCILEGND